MLSLRTRPPSGTKVLLARLLTSRVVGAAASAVLRGQIPNKGLRFDVTGVGWSDRLRASLLIGTYESAEIRLVIHHLPRDLPVIELGASLGVVACHVASRLQPQCTYLGVEPNASLAECARSALRAHSRCPWEVITAGIVPSGSDDFYFQHSDDPHSGRLVIAPPGSSSNVETMTLMAAAAALGHPRWSLIVDIEGLEHDVLTEEALAGCEFIVIEIHSTRSSTKEELIHRLVGFGFELADRDGNCYALKR